MSWFVSRVSALGRPDPARNGLVRPWHAACILLMPGCYYIGPPWTAVVNEPPYLVDKMPPGDTLQIGNSTSNSAYVRLDDPEGDAISVDWFIGNNPITGLDNPTTFVDETTGNTVSVLRFSPEEAPVSSTITCRFTDGENVGPTVQWTVVP